MITNQRCSDSFNASFTLSVSFQSNQADTTSQFTLHQDSLLSTLQPLPWRLDDALGTVYFCDHLLSY